MKAKGKGKASKSRHQRCALTERKHRALPDVAGPHCFDTLAYTVQRTEK